MNKIILIGGYCATGKTTFSLRLAERLQLPCFNKDHIKEVIGEGFGRESADVHRKNSAVTLQLMLHIAERQLRAGKACILESNFRIADGEQIKTLLGKYDSACLTYVFTADLDLLYNRYRQREAAGGRHWVHLNPDETRESFLYAHESGGHTKLRIGETIQVDATDFANIDFEALLRAGENFMQRNTIT
ncbi:MAG: ATP-binding protein [Clostridiales bacterium]|nr:ATP-binding protein [Clostridiales bacterium]